MNLELVRVKEAEFVAPEAPQRFLTANIWHCNYRSLAPLERLTALRELTIATYPDETLDPIGALGELRSLSIVHLPKVSELRPLANLVRLQKLSLSTLPSWDASNRRTEVDSFEPLAALSELQELTLAGITPSREGLQPLLSLQSLRSVRLGNYFSINDFAALRTRMPDLEGTFLKPLVELPISRCSKCGSSRVMLSGVPKYNLKCPKCHRKRVERHLAEWREAEAAAA